MGWFNVRSHNRTSVPGLTIHDVLELAGSRVYRYTTPSRGDLLKQPQVQGSIGLLYRSELGRPIFLYYRYELIAVRPVGYH